MIQNENRNERGIPRRIDRSRDSMTVKCTLVRIAHGPLVWDFHTVYFDHMLTRIHGMITPIGR